MHNKRIAIVYGDIPPDAPQDEQDTLEEVNMVKAMLTELEFEPAIVPLTLNLEQAKETLCSLKPALVFNLVESVNGSGQLIYLAPSLFEHLRLPYTGAPLTAIFTTSQKTLTKQLLRQTGIATPDWLETGTTITPVQSPAFGPPYIVKSVWEHASIGLDEHSLHTSRESLFKALTSAPGAANKQLPVTVHTNHSSHFFVEAFIEGREFNLSLLEGKQGVEVLPPAEIRFIDFPAHKPKIVGYKAKWDESSFEYKHTQRAFDFPKEDKLLLENLKIMALQCWQVFKLKGYARVDFRVDSHAQPWVLEVNVNPCISPGAGFMAATEKAGLSRTETIQRILDAR